MINDTLNSTGNINFVKKMCDEATKRKMPHIISVIIDNEGHIATGINVRNNQDFFNLIFDMFTSLAEQENCSTLKVVQGFNYWYLHPEEFRKWGEEK